MVIRIYGIGSDTDAFVASQALPQVVSSVVVSALNSVWLPKLSAYSPSPKKWRYVLSQSLGQAFVISVSISALVILGLKILIELIFPGFNDLQKENTFYFVFIFIISMVFTVLSSQLVNAMRTLNQFYHVEMINLFGSLLVLPLIYFVSIRYGLLTVAIVLMAKSIIVFVVQLKFSKWPVIFISRGIRDKASWKLMRPVFAGASIYKFSPLVDRFWLSFAPVGVMTVFNLAQNLVSAAAQVVEKSTVMSLTTNFGKLVNVGKYSVLKKQVETGIFRVTVISLSVLLIAFIFKGWIIYWFGIFFSASADYSYEIWLFCILLIGYFHSSPAATIPVSALYAFHDTKTPVITGVVGFIISILIKAVLFKIAGINGLVIGVSIYFVMNFLSHLTFLYKRNEFNTISH